MDNLTIAVEATIASDREMSERIAEFLRKNTRQTGEYDHQYAERIGNGICVMIGEDLSLRFDGVVENNGIHACLWSTFMGNVNWTEVGRYFMEDDA